MKMQEVQVTTTVFRDSYVRQQQCWFLGERHIFSLKLFLLLQGTHFVPFAGSCVLFGLRKVRARRKSTPTITVDASSNEVRMYPDPDKSICPRSRQTPRLPIRKENRPHETSAGTRQNSTHPLAPCDPSHSTSQLLVYYTQYTTFNQQPLLWETLPRPLTSIVLPH